MTTWQDQQPMSRRALRESERAHAQAVLSDTGEIEPRETPSDQQIWSQPSIAEPLDYATQARQPSPASGQPMRRPRPSGSSQGAPDASGYRVRDFSPEGRGTSFSSTQPAASPPWTPPAAGSEDLNYHTSVEFDRAAPTAFAGPVFVPPVVVTSDEVDSASSMPPTTRPASPEEHTLTRREMRELRNAALPPGAEHQPVIAPQVPPAERMEGVIPVERVVPVEPVTVVAEPTVMAPQPEQNAELAAAMAEFDALFLAKASPPPVPLVAEPATLIEPVPLADPAPLMEPTPVTPTPVAFTPVASTPIAFAAVPPAPVSPVPVSQESAVPAEPLREFITAPEVYAAPAGHWSNQTGIDDEYAGAVGTHSRNLAASDAITTNALVLPTFPQTGPLTAPVNSTGEILMTGSIDLPRSLGMNGFHPGRYDRPDIDAIIDAGDREDSAPDSAPVRAIRAVSTHTSSQGIINIKRPKGSNLPMILSITAGVMAVGVIVLFVAGMIFKIF